MAALITLATAKKHLRVTTTDQDGDILLKLTQAEALVLGRCNSTAWWRAITPTWTSATVPGGVQAAILTTLTHLRENRGDDMHLDESFWASVMNLITMNKDPVLQ